MKLISLLLISMLSFTAMAQTPSTPASPPSAAPPPPPPQTPPPAAITPPERTTTTNWYMPQPTNRYIPTNRFFPTNRFIPTNFFPTNGTPTNETGFSNQVVTPDQFGTNGVAVDFSITNTLASMSPTQVRSVQQVQTSLGTLRTIAMRIGPSQNFQVVEQNVQVQQQVQQVALQIQSLAVGPVKPSIEVTTRLSRDLLRVFAPAASLTPDRELVLAVTINQICNCQSLAAPQIEAAVDTGVGVLQSSGAPMSVAHLVRCDLHSMAFELQPNLTM